MSCSVTLLQESVDGEKSDITDTPSNNTDSTPYYGQEAVVTFFPSLNDTRRAWILKKLRQECVNSVLDVGCGAGVLLGCLCNSPAFLNSTDDKVEDKENTNIYRASTSDDGFPDLHISRIAGLDISSRALEKCIISTTPLPVDYYLYMPRWQRLEAKIWRGSLDVYNPEFEDIECIIASEVIEHLPPSVLPAFAPTLLGLYRPRILLITTPNYAFNARFSAPGTIDPAGFLDPTGRTNRVFRHHDHKFEWTPSEFKAWCDDAAATWGYNVEVDAVGLAMEPDAWGRDDELGCASQVALFRREDNWQGQRPVPPLPSQESIHDLLETHIHLPHPRAGFPESHKKICELVTKHMESYYFDDGYSVWDLWVESTISIACGGRLDALLSAIEASPVLCLARKKDAAARDWNVKFIGDKHREAVEESKKRYWDRRIPQDDQAREEEIECSTVESPKWPDPAQERYNLPNHKDEEQVSSSRDDWMTEKTLSMGKDETRIKDICA
ncbi:hypothetical protein ACEPAG_6966 [Sanghuangporus baumii]